MSNDNGVSILDIPVEFGGVSIGENTARLGVKVDRSRLNIDAADECFCGHRLTGRVVLGHSDDQPGQMTFDDVDIQVVGSFDSKQVSLRPEAIATGLTFNLKEIDVADLAKFSKGKGRLIVDIISEIPEEHDGDKAIVPGTLRASGPWRDVALDTLFDGAVRKSLAAANLNTVGQLADYTATGNQRITDIKGIGESKAEHVETVMVQFWKENPQDA